MSGIGQAKRRSQFTPEEQTAIDELAETLGLEVILKAEARAQVMLSLYTDFENFATFKPAAHHEQSVHTMIDQLVAWGSAMKMVREGTLTAAAQGA